MVYWQVIVLIKQTIFTSVILLFLLCTPVMAIETPQISAKSAVLYDPLSDQILYAKNEEEVLGMASTTKIMTALVALEQYDLQQSVLVKKSWTGIEGSSMYLQEGEVLTLQELLYGLMLSSGNDAAVAIAEHIAGDTEQFAFLMNERARMLGADANFVTPNGLDAQGHGASSNEASR